MDRTLGGREADVRADSQAGKLFQEAVAIMARLRAPGGCPWDREQTFASIRKYTLEETYEVLDAIEREHWRDLEDELGDLLLQVLFYAEMAAEAGHFGIDGVIEGLNRKLVRRHPHVFGEEASAAAGNRAQGLEMDGLGAAEVLRNWDEIKKLEKNGPRDPTQAEGGLAWGTPAGTLDEVSRAMPALSEAGKIGSKAAKVGFDWPDVQGVVEKLREECGELETEVARGDKMAATEEIGDLLFTVANLARHLKFDPELALRDANAKFRRRFAGMEAATERPLEELSAAELEELWARSKEAERRA
ncbi:MAG TPA: nucleoside triphosphate pyrophosphohydrolase [Acidobacteriaceae bacterium]|nr:nucleoside triphosphate pyrophosphohydrolase [Acidobacteriaceae bacterium]